jgi:hypothetical protein
MHSFDQGTNSSTGVGVGNDWNLNNNNLEINDDDSQNQYGAIDMLSNGFKVRNATNAFGAADENADGGTYVYMAWAYAPLATSAGTPAPAR